MKLKMMMILIILMGYIQNATAQTDIKIFESVQSDIDIMETVLDRIFGRARSEMMMVNNGTCGFYLDGYGILFKIPYASPIISPDFFIRKNQGEAFEKAFLRHKDVKISTNVDEKEWHEELTKIKNNSARFLGDYMAAMEYLNPEQWITLIVDFNSYGRWGEPFLFNKSGQQLMIKVQKKNISAYHKGSIKFDDLKNSIQYITTDDQKSEIESDIDIFSDIMESDMQNNRANSEFHLIDDITGFYLQGYGAIFLVKANFESHIINIISRAKGVHNFSIQTYSSGGDSIDMKEKVRTLEERIITIFSRFGHTLKQLGSDEWLEVAIHVDSSSHKNEFSKVVIKVKKHFIDDLKSQKMSMHDFKRSINIVKY